MTEKSTLSEELCKMKRTRIFAERCLRGLGGVAVKAAVASLLLCACSGCFTNYYAKHYRQKTMGMSHLAQKKWSGKVEIRPVTTEEGVISALEAGYVPLGASSFSDLHCPWFCLVDQAKKVGADLVLVDETFKGEEKRTSVVFLPSHTMSHTYGSLLSSSGKVGAISATTASTTLKPVQTEVKVKIYNQAALFLRKGNFDSIYGVILYVPPRLPDDPKDAQVSATTLAVLKGSQAEKDGVVHGKRVKSVNGIPVTTRSSVEAFAQNPRLIKCVEVE